MGQELGDSPHWGFSADILRHYPAREALHIDRGLERKEVEKNRRKTDAASAMLFPGGVLHMHHFKLCWGEGRSADLYFSYTAYLLGIKLGCGH